ncbi:prostaglandin D2 receptor 2-like isoform X2 [Gambusia affinis]|nr:prostaglandin D2 receptor 2-like isoform X2 [Gambusia affinis]XP_043971083.1 prostaglandin D2 receptor 2-like isoform X2 [Gambusia affinis]XP_043971084.1 prostaglandin D2 receptor 2-like isoform X2 [Gambusia affinis]
MFNMVFTSNVSEGPLFCPLLKRMREDSINNNTQANMVVISIHGIFSSLGILENALIIWVLGFRLRHRTVASIWMLNLAMSDFLATLTLPLYTFYFYYSQSWEFGQPLCIVQSSIIYFNMFVSAFLLAAISLDRLLLVSKPVWSMNHRSVAGAWKVCGLGWLWASINTMPYSVFRSVTVRTDGRKMCYHNFALYLSSKDSLEMDCNLRQGATAISKLLLAFVFPLVIIAGSYITIALSLRNTLRRRKQSTGRLAGMVSLRSYGAHSGRVKTNGVKPLTSGSSFESTLNKPSPVISSPSCQRLLSQSFTKMVTFVIAAFVLCWAPYHIFSIIDLTSQYNEKIYKLMRKGLPLSASFASLNLVLNPVLYVFSCPNFCVRIRQSLGAVFEGLVEEGGLMTPGRNLQAYIRRSSTRDVSFAPPGSPKSPKSSSYQSSGAQLPFPLLSKDLGGSQTDQTGQ